MAEFRMKIAGKTAAVTSLFESTPHYFKSYLTEDAPDFSIILRDADLRFQQQVLDQEADEEGFRRRVFTDPFLERNAILQAFWERLLDWDTILLHGSTVVVDGKAYLFTARSGTGKSTHTRLWREVFGSRAVMLNDDRAFLRLEEAQVLAFGSPWSGKHGLDANIAAPLQGICLLERGEENCITPAEPGSALPMLIHQMSLPRDPAARAKYAPLAERIAAQVPLWQMRCNKSPQAAQIAWETMAVDKNTAG